MTYEAIAQAFGRGLALNSEIAAAIDASRRSKGHAPTAAQNKMALFPDPCRLIRHPNIWVPTVVVDRVHILPGIPMLFQRYALWCCACRACFLFLFFCLFFLNKITNKYDKNPGSPACLPSPCLVRMLDDSIAQGEVRGPGRLHTMRIVTQQSESALAQPLADIAARFAPRGVKIGSYPKAGHVLLAVEGPIHDAVQAAAAEIAVAVDGKVQSE